MYLLMGFGLACLSLLLMAMLQHLRHPARADAPTAARNQYHEKSILLILFSVSGYLVEPLFPAHYHWIPFSLLILGPPAFFLVCLTYFADRARLTPLWMGIALYSCVPPILISFFRLPTDQGVLAWVGWRLPQLGELLLVLHGLLIIVRNWRDDLIEERRHWRKTVVILIGGTALFVVIFDNFISQPRWIPHALVVSCIWLVTCRWLIARQDLLQGALTQTRATACGPVGLATAVQPLSVANAEPAAIHAVTPSSSAPTQAGKPDDGEQEHLQAQLDQLIAAGFYRADNLSIGRLARQMQIPEYRLRKLINSDLGYRNFNDFVNQLRIREAAARLLAEPATPILNISLDVGYRSLTSFNRAFKDQLAVTPTQWRQQTPPSDITLTKSNNPS